MKIRNRYFVYIVIESFVTVCKVASKKPIRVSVHISFNGYYHSLSITGKHLKL